MTEAAGQGASRNVSDDAEDTLLGAPTRVVKRGMRAGYAIVLLTYLAVRIVPVPAAASEVGAKTALAILVGFTTFALYRVMDHTQGMERRFWGFAVASGMFLLFARIYELSSVLTSGVVRSISFGLPEVMYALALVAFLALLVSFSGFRHASTAARVRYVLDIATVALIGGAALELWLVGPWLERLGIIDISARTSLSMAPVLAAFGFVGMVTILVGTKIEKWETWERTLALSVAAFAVVLAFAPLSYADAATGVFGGWARSASEAVWLTGVYLVLTASVYRQLGSRRIWRLRPAATLEPSYGWVPSVVLPSLEVLALPLFGLAAAQADDPSVRAMRLAAVGLIAAAIAVRTVLTVMDTDALTAGAVVDPLTGLHDLRHFHERLTREVADAVRFGEGVSLIELDVDDFAEINAISGHAAGDAVLVALARAAEGAVRTRDVMFRTGGDEFAVILPGTAPDTAQAIAVRLLEEVRSVTGPQGRHVTLSAGVASLPTQASDRGDLIERADAALYWAKTHGKDRAMVFDPALVIAAGADERVRLTRERADSSAVRALAAAVDARDEQTQDHSRNVARQAVALAHEIGLDDRTTRMIENAALLHDIGKIGVSDAILHKDGVYTVEERAAMREHAALGAAILASTTMQEIIPWVRHHHERWDGTGYPDGLAGEDIPLGARIIALANAYDALRSDRPHRKAVSRSAALQEIDLGLGTAFDPALGERFIDSVGRTYL